MRLRRLETYGFKSFADRLTFDFEEGITAIIGPNGCGKSNVVDSIKWVIGEQSAKALRGQDMTDVIFNGCSTRRALPFCEVTLVMDQLHHALPGIDTDEVAITRRLFRDGNSAYYLNGKACRLKDIKEIFLGTGMGTSAYAVIEQGRVGFILESNAKDRRLILEEAAGISRFKNRRKVAQRKLERVQIDLQRIGEVLGEVRRRAKTVAKQAAAALRFRELEAQVRELRLAFALEEFGRLSTDLRLQSHTIEQIALGQADAATSIGVAEAALAQADTLLITLDADLRAAGEERSAATSRRDVAAHRAKDAQDRLAEADAQEREDRAALEAIAQRLANAEADQAKAEAELALLGDGPGDDAVAGPSPLREARAAADAALAEADALVQRIEEAKARQVECLRSLSRIEAERGRLESAKQATNDRRRRMEDRTGGQAGQLMHARQAEADAVAAVETAMKAAVEAHGRLDDAIRAKEDASADGNRLDQELSDLRHQSAQAETSLRLYREQEHRAEGVQRGVRDVLVQGDKIPGLVGMVADLCRIPDADVTAIETALGQQAQNIVVETQDDAKAAIEFLKRERRGRATFLPLDDVRGSERIDQRLLREPGVVGVASRLVDFEPRLQAVFEYLLGNILVVETLDDGIALRRRHRPSCRIVSRDGEVINAGGAMTGGRNQGQESGGVVSRKHEIAKLADQVDDLVKRRERLTTARDEARKRAFELNLQVEEVRRAIQAADRTVADARAKAMAAERDRLHLDEAASGFGAELEEIAGELGKLEAEGKELAGQHDWFTALNTNLTGDIDGLQVEVIAAGAKRDRLTEAYNTLRVSHATTAERREAARNHLGHLLRSRQELQDQRDERTRRLEGLDTRRMELRTVMEAATAVHTEEAANTAALAGKVEELLNARDRQRAAMEELKDDLKTFTARAKSLDRERQEAELKANEARVRIDALTVQTLDDHQIDLAEAFTHYRRPDDFDPEGLKSQLDAADAELKAIGPVNLAAIDELEEVQAREGFLGKQFDDLTKAMETLEGTIDDLNQISGKLFEETYRTVRTNFQLMFRKLFGGGRADLELEEKDEEGKPVDPLDAGLEIRACPPGKNPKIITQLSGGEKALTAIALLFAVYRTKPSPFCILDEVDAPLDEANVDVYNNVVREFTTSENGGPGSQFIVITHRKRTMQRADAIYGITQNEPGVSTKISVRFEDVERGTQAIPGLGETKRGAGPFAG